MGLSIGDNFSYQGKKPNFDRDQFSTLAEMKAFPETSIDEGHVSFCAENGKHYKYKSGNTVDPVTGKWREFATVDTALSDFSENAVQNKVITNKFSELGLGTVINYLTDSFSLNANGFRNGYIGLDGIAVIDNSNYRYSDFILLKSGKEYYVTAAGSINTLIVAAYSSNEESTFLPDSPLNIKGSNAIKGFSIKPSTDVYVRLTCNLEYGKIQDFGIIEVSGGKIKNIDDSFKDVDNKINILDAGIKDNKVNLGSGLPIDGLIIMPIKLLNGYIRATDGVFVPQSSAYYASDYIEVEPGEEYVCIMAGSASTGMSCYSDTNEESFISTLIKCEGTIKSYRFVAPNGVNYVRTTFNDNYADIRNFSFFRAVGTSFKSFIENSGVFEWFDINTKPTTLSNNFAGQTRGQIYSAFKVAKFINFDESEKIVKLFVVWNTNEDIFQVRLAKYQEGVWVQTYTLSYDYSAVNPTKKGLLSIIYNIQGTNKRIEFTIDTSLIQNTGGNVFSPLTENPEYIFSKTCFINENQINIETHVPRTIKLFPNTKLPTISFQFDDIVDNDVMVHDLFIEKGLTCGFAFVASDSKLVQYKERYLGWQKEGFDIYNHSTNGDIFNTTNYTYDTALATIAEAKEKLEKAGFVVNGWVSPSSSLDASFLPIIKMFHAYGATFQDEYKNGRESNPCQLIRYSLESHTLEEIKAEIDRSIENDKILVFYGHSSNFNSETPVTGGIWDINKLKDVLEYCIEKRNKGLCYLGNTDDCIKYYFDL